MQQLLLERRRQIVELVQDQYGHQDEFIIHRNNAEEFACKMQRALDSIEHDDNLMGKIMKPGGLRSFRR